MISDDNKKVVANTLGNIAKNYGVGVSILKNWIMDYPELEKEVEIHCKHASKNKGSKLLPPLLVKKIYDTLGMP